MESLESKTRFCSVALLLLLISLLWSQLPSSSAQQQHEPNPTIRTMEDFSGYPIHEPGQFGSINLASSLSVDAPGLQKQIEELSSFSDAPSPSVTRVLYTDKDVSARRYVKNLMTLAALSVREDAVGNIFGKWDGSEPSLPAVATGSHIDAIPYSGKYDGVVGVLGAIEAINVLKRSGFKPKRSLEIIMFTSEEPTRFGISCLGSRLLAGSKELAEALKTTVVDGQNVSFIEAAKSAGYAEDEDFSSVFLKKGSYFSFIELHIEQGPILEDEGLDIGVVTAIAAPASIKVEFEGNGGHAGAVLMPYRNDAGLAAAELALAVEKHVLESAAMDSVKLPTAPSSLRTQMSPHHFHHLPLPHRSFRLKPVIGITRSRSHHVSPVAVLFREETSLAPLDLPLPRLKVSPNSLQYPPGYLGAVPERASDHDNGSIVEAMEYLTNILSTKVYDIAVESPLHLAKKLSERLGVRIFLKREDLQPVKSFKLRGAYNMMVKLTSEQLAKGVICSSAGNHAQGVAMSAAKLGCTAVIVMPRTTPEIKWQSVEDLGATVVLVGDSYDEAQAFAKQRAEEEGLTFIPPFDHPDVIAGQGTVGMEITRQAKGPLHAIFVPIGGGGLIAGIASYVKRVCPEVKIIGVEPADANTMALSLHHRERVILDQVGGFADGVAVKEVGKETFRICQNLVDGVVLVTRDAICASIKDMFEEQRNILEPAGALALAGGEAYCKYYGLKDVNVVAITSGANMNFDKLRIVTELANVGRQQEAVLATLLPEKPGSFKQFCELIGPMNITEFKYRCGSEKESVVLYSVGMHTAGELKALEKRMESSQLRTRNLTTSDLVKDHLRYLMGGRSSVEEEVLCRFTFPERPGALMNFLDSFSPRWNISLFHYRAEGGAGANVLVGIQVSDQEIEEFRNRAQVLGYEYVLVSEDAIFNLLMH